MRILLFIILSVLCSSIPGQGQERISTKAIADIADVYGVDSALRLLSYHVDIHLIDTPTALYLALKCQNPERFSRQLEHLSKIGQLLKDERLNSQAVDAIVSYRNLLMDEQRSRYASIPIELFHVVLFQNRSGITEVLKGEFEFWQRKSDSIKNKLPSGLKGFFQSFSGPTPTVEVHNTCRANAYGLAWTLNRLNMQEFDSGRLANLTRQLLKRNPRGYKYMEQYRARFSTPRLDTVLHVDTTSSSFNALSYEQLVELVKRSGVFVSEYTKVDMILNGPKALCVVRRSIFINGDGGGDVLLLEWADGNYVKIYLAGGWRS